VIGTDVTPSGRNLLVVHFIRRLALLLGLVALGALALRLVRRAVRGPGDTSTGPAPTAPLAPAAEAAPSTEPAPVESSMAAPDPDPTPAPRPVADPETVPMPDPTPASDAAAVSDPAAPAPFVVATEGSCPATHPVKVKESSGIFHVPGGASYERTAADRCYPTPEAAAADGYRAAKR
jgi:hypothetical protein